MTYRYIPTEHPLPLPLALDFESTLEFGQKPQNKF